ncbi:MAG: hypothetical protein M1818_002884 [Claussenomyces sp. TS43310]|nr:MAG: hypothetical protein M1818_002884 [Claussenomyces sp. TS43310]
MAHNYILRVTAGSSYDPSTHSVVAVNTAKPLRISSDLVDVDLNVRIQNYRGLPRGSPASSPYFDTAPHAYNQDQYSIAFGFTLKERAISADALVFGNDFDHPIRDRLPPGFGTAMRIVKWGIDPGLDGDPYADEPYLYGPLASSINTLSVGGGGGGGGSEGGKQAVTVDDAVGLVLEEGGDAHGQALRTAKNVPETEAARRKHFLNEANRQAFDFEAGRQFGCDFFNAYLDFNDFALRLPGFTLPIMKYWDGQGLRYVLKDRKTNTVLFVVVFTLYLKEDVLEDGSIKPGVEGGKPHAKTVESGEDAAGNEQVIEDERVEKVAPIGEDTSADDID